MLHHSIRRTQPFPRVHHVCLALKGPACQGDRQTATGGDIVETLRRWKPDQIELRERLRDYGQRLSNRSQFDR